MGVLRKEAGERCIGVQVSMTPAFIEWFKDRCKARGVSVSDGFREPFMDEWRASRVARVEYRPKAELVEQEIPIEKKEVKCSSPVDACNPCGDCGNKACDPESDPCKSCGAPGNPDRWGKERA